MHSSSSNSTNTSEQTNFTTKDRFQFVKRLNATPNNKYLFNINDYEHDDTPHKGNYGLTLFATKKTTGKKYVIKKSHNKCNPDHFFYNLRKMSNLIHIHHPSIIPIEGFAYDEEDGNNYITILMRYIQSGSLADLLKKEIESKCPSNYDNTKRQIILVGISYAMMHLHSKKVIHENLKPSNILLDKNYKPLITDFGLSKIFNPYNLRNEINTSIRHLTYISPEMVKNNRYGEKSDAYSFGILMYEIVSGKYAYDENNGSSEFLKKVTKEKMRPKFDFPIKKEIQQMIECCLSHDPKKRPTFQELFFKLALLEDHFLNEPSIKVEDDEFSFKKFCLEGVNIEELCSYVDELLNYNEEKMNKEYEIEKLNEQIELSSQTAEELKSDNSKLTKIISHLECKIDPEKAKQRNLEKKCFELRKKVDKGELTSIELPDELLRIPDELFKDCTNLKEIIISSSVTIIGEKSFLNCSSLVKVEIPSSVIEINENAFENCSSLKNIELPSQLQALKSCCFKGCTSLTSAKIPSSIDSIPESTFYECSSLISFETPSSVKYICRESFYHCSSLVELKIPSSVTNIYSCAFIGCSSLTKIEIPESVTFISSHVFSGCSSLQSIKIPSSVTQIGLDAFNDCSSLTSIEIPSSLTTFEGGTFYGCKKLKNVSIPPSTTIIKWNLFSFCSSLTSIEIPSSVTIIENSAFYQCSSLKIIKIPSSVTYIGNSVFKYCESLTSIEIPSSVTTIEEETFYGCSSLKCIKIPSLVTKIEKSAFCSCYSLTSIEIPSSVTYIGNEAFMKCESLTSIEIPSSVTYIGEHVFSDCKSLTKITAPSSLSVNNFDAHPGCRIEKID